MENVRRTTAWLLLAFLLASCAGVSTSGGLSDRGQWGEEGVAPALELRPAQGGGQVEPDPVLIALEDELKRQMKILSEKASPPPYYISYTVTETMGTTVEASVGALTRQNTRRTRWLDVEVRVGDYKLDNTNRNRGGGGGFHSQRMPLDADPDAVRELVWRVTERAYRSASAAYIRVETNDKVSVEEEDDSGDFSVERPEVNLQGLEDHEVDIEAWSQQARSLSSPFKDERNILGSMIALRATTTNTIMVNTEGTRLQFGDQRANFIVHGTGLAQDGMELVRHESVFARSPQALPGDEVLEPMVTKLIRDLNDLREAPVVEPWVGPVILSGRAAGVFFHEIFGHRIEGHRQRDEQSGQTFTQDLNKAVLPSFPLCLRRPDNLHLRGRAAQRFLPI